MAILTDFSVNKEYFKEIVKSLFWESKMAEEDMTYQIQNKNSA